MREKPTELRKVAEPSSEKVSEIICSLTPEEQKRLSLIQELLEAQGQPNYGQRCEALAQKEGITVRSLRRWLQNYRKEGIASVVKQRRKDRGSFKIDKEWQEFIVKTYKEGNRGSKRMSPAQVAVRVKVRALELGRAEYPSHMSVYRLIRSYFESGERKKRTLGWRGDCLKLKTREGITIAVEWSNQVWQCDHTKVDVLVVGQTGEIIGRPWLTTVIDSYSRCVMGINLGFEAPSAAVVCLALRHAILPKQYSSGYELKESWGTYGLPQYLYTDGGVDLRSRNS